MNLSADFTSPQCGHLINDEKEGEPSQGLNITGVNIMTNTRCCPGWSWCCNWVRSACLCALWKRGSPAAGPILPRPAPSLKETRRLGRKFSSWVFKWTVTRKTEEEPSHSCICENQWLRWWGEITKHLSCWRYRSWSPKSRRWRDELEGRRRRDSPVRGSSSSHYHTHTSTWHCT